MSRETVRAERCWGCGRLRIERPWTPGTLELLRRERRLVMGEYLCDREDCPATAIADKR